MSTEKTIPIESNQVYEDDRTGDKFELIYIDDNVYVAQNQERGHRLGKMHQFQDNVDAGRYKLQEDAEKIASVESIDRGNEEVAFEELDNIGQSAASNLRKEGIVTRQDVADASDERILDVSWVGDGGLESIREAVE